MFGIFSQHKQKYKIPEQVAAVDLGSNSFHMIVARIRDGHMEVIDRMKEMVRLASGLDEHKNLTPAIQATALACLERFGQRVRAMPPGSVRAVGTNTLRSAHNAQDFLRRAEDALGHPIETIAGREEARLIYLGVAHGLPDVRRQCLVMDIGGGSTEFIIGKGFETLRRESLFMGCVSMSLKFFADGKLTDERMRQAEILARLELQPIAEEYRQTGWELVMGSSGSIRAIGAVIRENQWNADSITPESLAKLRAQVLAAGHVDKLNLAGLSEERKPVFAGGLAVLLAAFNELGITAMQVSDYALREGLVYDLMGRIQHEDIRERTIQRLLEKFRIDKAQAQRVADTAKMLHTQVRGTWDFNGEECQCVLRWSAQLHEIGLMIAHNQYHKHGAYILSNSDLSGFSRREQNIMAALVRAHRRKFPIEAFAELPESDAPIAIRLCAILRLAVLLRRNQSDTPLPSIALHVEKKPLSAPENAANRKRNRSDTLILEFPPQWLQQHPLTKADLQCEAEYLKAADIVLKF